MALTKEDLIVKLKECAKNPDKEAGNGDADRTMLDFINDKDVSKAFKKGGYWYA